MRIFVLFECVLIVMFIWLIANLIHYLFYDFFDAGKGKGFFCLSHKLKEENLKKGE